MFENFKGNIIWSADGISLPELLNTLRREDFPREHVAVKLDRLFLTTYGLNAISAVQQLGIPVFADAKIIEIPSKVQEIAKLHLEHRPWMLNAMAGICNNGVAPTRPGDSEADEIYQFANLCRDAGTKSCVVTVLTSKKPNFASHEFNSTVREAVEFYTELSINCGITDIVCSPLEASYVRALDPSIDINTPSVRLPDSSKDDQGRVATPAEALAYGATRLVIGRDLSRGGKFKENYAAIMANINGG